MIAYFPRKRTELHFALAEKRQKSPRAQQNANGTRRAPKLGKERDVHKKANGTRRTSQAVPHPSTIRALCRLTSEFGWDRVYSTQYGRWQQSSFDQRKAVREDVCSDATSVEHVQAQGVTLS